MKASNTRKYTDFDECESTDITDGLTLADAIVIQACTDYRAAIRGEGECPEQMISDVLKFFESEWYEILTKIDRHYLLESMDKEYELGKRLIAAGLKVDCPKVNEQYKFECPICGGEAETHEIQFISKKRNDGTRKITYKRVFSCSCHIPERVTVREKITGGDTNESY